MWRLRSSQPSFTAEVFLHSPPPNMLLHYHNYALSSTGRGTTEPSVNGESACNYYFSERFDSSYSIMISNNAIMMKFITTVYPGPVISSSHSASILLPPSSPSFTLSFHSLSNEANQPEGRYINTANTRCYHNGLPLVPDWRTAITVDFVEPYWEFNVTVTSPRDRDSGYYQCGVFYDVFYISSHTRITVQPGGGDGGGGVMENMTDTSVALSWQRPGGYSELFRVFVSSDPSPTTDPHTTTSNTTMILTSLTPYRVYNWWVTTTYNSPLTDTLTFRTAKAAPRDAVVGPVAVISGETSLALDWPEISRTLWYDETLRFTVSISPGSQNYVVDSGYALFEKLSMGTEYNITITPQNSVGDGPVTVVPARTNHQVLKTSPLVRLVETSKSSIEILVWDSETETATNVSKLLEIFPENQCFYATEKPVSELYKLKTDKFIIDDLSSFSTYSVRVHASNGFSTSPWSEFTIAPPQDVAKRCQAAPQRNPVFWPCRELTMLVLVRAPRGDKLHNSLRKTTVTSHNFIRDPYRDFNILHTNSLNIIYELVWRTLNLSKRFHTNTLHTYVGRTLHEESFKGILPGLNDPK
eukprot:sb/3463324/